MQKVSLHFFFIRLSIRYGRSLILVDRICPGLGELKSRRPDSRSVSSVSSSQCALSSVASSNSIDLSPYRNCSRDSDQNTNMWISPVMQGKFRKFMPYWTDGNFLVTLAITNIP